MGDFTQGIVIVFDAAFMKEEHVLYHIGFEDYGGN
jgi:hypothetical protein